MPHYAVSIITDEPLGQFTEESLKEFLGGDDQDVAVDMRELESEECEAVFIRPDE
jgi:hypothetical protein